jgi:hypothetical protein
LHQADLLHLLPALFGSVQVPSAVAGDRLGTETCRMVLDLANEGH